MAKGAKSRVNEFKLVDKYPLGYRHREDVTNLPPGVLIVGSQNVLSNVSERLQIRQGYSVDGEVSDVAAPILSSFDWETRGNGEVHVRAGFLTSAGNNGRLQYRYVDENGDVTWRDIATGLSTVAYNFCTYWNTTESLREMLYVNGSPNIFRWNGATAVVLSATATTITKTGTESWLDSGFYSSGNKIIVINGTSYTYTGGENTTTLTGVTPSAAAVVPGDIVHQAPVATANSSMTNIPSTFQNGLIQNLNNQIFVGSLTSPALYISKVNDFTDFSSSTPRQAGEGSVLILDENLVAFKPQEQYMYVSAGKDQWYNVNFELQTSTVGVTYEQVNAERLKTGPRQGALSQAGVSHMKNNIITITNETTIDMIGRMENYFETPQTKNISDPIKLDIDSYNFTDASIFYWRYYILVAVPREEVVRVFNLINNAWESPLTIPVSRFYIVDGELYGHSYLTSESYKLFTGYADRVYPGFSGFPINAKWVFSYQNYGSRSIYKSANALYIEGYINANTVASAMITYELDGCAIRKTFEIDGSDTQIVCIPNSQGSFGKDSFGKIKLGGDSINSIQNLPPKFRVKKTFTNTDFFECSISFEVLGVDNRMELLAFGLNASESTQITVKTSQ